MDICENTDCEHKNNEFKSIQLTKDFDSTFHKWCVDCIERDNDMIEINSADYECEWCENKQEKLTEFEYYTSPFNDKPYIANLCDECIDNIDTISYCEYCNRHISNNDGYRINVRYGYIFNNQEYELTCVKCLQDLWFEYGMESFKHADFFNYKDLSDNGFDKIHSFFCQSKESYNLAEQTFNKLKETNLVIVQIDSSGHIEHHISLYVKPKKEINKKE